MKIHPKKIAAVSSTASALFFSAADATLTVNPSKLTLQDFQPAPDSSEWVNLVNSENGIVISCRRDGQVIASTKGATTVLITITNVENKAGENALDEVVFTRFEVWTGPAKSINIILNNNRYSVAWPIEGLTYLWVKDASKDTARLQRDCNGMLVHTKYKPGFDSKIDIDEYWKQFSNLRITVTLSPPFPLRPDENSPVWNDSIKP